MRRRLLSVVSSLVLLPALLACALTTPAVVVEPTIPPPTAAVLPGPLPDATDTLDQSLFAQLLVLYRVFAKSSDGIWDGLYRPDQWPLLFVRIGADGQPLYGYLVNAPNPPTDAVPLSPNPDGLPAVHRITEGLTAFSDPGFYFDLSFQLGDLSLLAVRYQEEEDDPRDQQWLAYVIHEGFHRLQDETWTAPQEWDQEVDYPLTTENIALALLEQRVLVASLDAANDRAYDSLRLFVAVRARRLIDNPAVSLVDNSQEWSEGTADYTERLFTKLAGITDASSLQEGLEEPLMIEAERVRDTFSWDRYYATGTALGLLMDRAEIAWRPAIAQGQTPYDIMANALSLSDADLVQLLDQAKASFDYSSLADQAQWMVED